MSSFLIGVIAGMWFGWAVCHWKTWACILDSWNTRDIRIQLEGGDEAKDAKYTLGWLAGHRDIVRELDASPWLWWFTKRKTVNIVLDENN